MTTCPAEVVASTMTSGILTSGCAMVSGRLVLLMHPVESMIVGCSLLLLLMVVSVSLVLLLLLLLLSEVVLLLITKEMRGCVRSDVTRMMAATSASVKTGAPIR